METKIIKDEFQCVSKFKYYEYPGYGPAIEKFCYLVYQATFNLEYEDIKYEKEKDVL